ncbi:MAG TPA: rod shape-determining protein MreC [Planctomycetota bacterium]|nr:rod shape-determining protein MreC [Planctomycetota bacterium]
MRPAAARLAASFALLALGTCPAAERGARAAASTAGIPVAALLSLLAPSSGPPPSAPPASAEDPVAGFLRDEARSLLPADPARRAHSFLHAGVSRRAERGGILVLEAGTEDGVAVGTPAILGDALLGFVESASPRACRVRTVLSPRFRAAARISREGEGEPSLVVAGTGGPFLSIAVAERIEEVRSGDAVLCAPSPFPPAEEGLPGPLAEGFVLGTVDEAGRGRPTRVRPAADPSRASAALLLLGGGEEVRLSRSGAGAPSLEARAFGVEVSPGRRSLLLMAGVRDGVREGDPVSLGPRLFGFAAGVGPWSCRVRLVGDPGLALPLSLRREGEGAVFLGVVLPERAGRFRTGGVKASLRGSVHFAGEGLARGLVVGRGDLVGEVLTLEGDFDASRIPSLEVLRKEER